MAANNSETRWELLRVSIKDESFTLLDRLTKKRRIYHVPYLLHVEFIQQVAYIFTSNSKIMRLNLLTATRQFLSATQLKSLAHVQKIHQSLYMKNTVNRKPKRSLINIASLPEYAFSNTINTY